MRISESPPSLRPFRGYLVRPEWASRVVSPAYDALTPSERGRWLRENPDSFLHVTRSPGDVDEAGGLLALDDLLAANRTALHRLLDRGAFAEEPAPMLYIYRVSAGGHEQTGIVGEVPLARHELGLIRPHERTNPERVHLLAAHKMRVLASSSPVTMAFRADRQLRATITELTATAPDLEIADAVVGQSVWRVARHTDIERIVPALGLDPFYITDGHHRIAAALEAWQYGGPDHVLAAVFPHHELDVRGFHRIVTDRGGLDLGLLLARLEPDWEIQPTEPNVASTPMTLIVDDRWFRLAPRRQPADAVDAEVVQARLLGPILGITDPTDDPRLRYLPADRPASELAEACPAGGLAVAMRPTPIDLVLATADAGRILPPKSTYFVPKARSGVFLVRHE